MIVHDTPIRSFPAPDSGLEPHRRVKLSNGALAYADATDEDIGTLERRHIASGLGKSGAAGVVIRHAQGTVKMIAAGAIAAGAEVFGAEEGKVTGIPNDNRVGINVGRAAGADGDEVEILRAFRSADLWLDAIADVHRVADDFSHYTADDRWSLETAIDGTAAIADTPGGAVAITTADMTAGNEDAYLASVAATFLFDAGKPLIFEAAVQFTEGASDKANVLVGLMDGVASGALQNDGAGPKASYSGAVFYKVADENVWRCQSSVGAAKVTTQTALPAGGATPSKLRIEFEPLTATAGVVRFRLDGALVATHPITFTGAEAMQLVAGVKDGATAVTETLVVDYLAAAQKRG